MSDMDRTITLAEEYDRLCELYPELPSVNDEHRMPCFLPLRVLREARRDLDAYDTHLDNEGRDRGECDHRNVAEYSVMGEDDPIHRECADCGVTIDDFGEPVL